MKNFTIILFIFCLIFLLGSLLIIDPLLVFLAIFLAFLISVICLFHYAGAGKAFWLAFIFIPLPFIIEHLGYRFNLPFFGVPIIRALTADRIDLPITLNSLFSITSIPLLFMTALFFSHKIKLFFRVKNLHKTFIVISSTILVAINFLIISPELSGYNVFFKWLAIALIINFIAIYFYKFRIETPETYKELPIIIFLAIYASQGLRTGNQENIVIALILTVLYLYILYTEYKIRKIHQHTAS